MGIAKNCGRAAALLLALSFLFLCMASDVLPAGSARAAPPTAPAGSGQSAMAPPARGDVYFEAPGNLAMFSLQNWLARWLGLFTPLGAGGAARTSSACLLIYFSLFYDGICAGLNPCKTAEFLHRQDGMT